MSAAAVLGVLWLAAGIVLWTRWWGARGPEGVRGTRLDVPANARFGQVRDHRSPRRLQAMRLAYAAGALLVAVGILSRVPFVLALGAAMVNLGTIYRYLVVALDLEAVDTPLFTRTGLPESALT